MINQIRKEIKTISDPKRATALQRFFKTGKGEYGYGDVFVGLTLPQIRNLVKKYQEMDLKDVVMLLQSKIHEERMIALLVLVEQYKKANEKVKKQIFNLYLANTKYINSWDLVDVTTPRIIGEYLKDKDRSILYKLAKSDGLWEKRISIMATYQFIATLKQFKDTFAIADILLNDKHDLIHKAVGWMLREVGKRISQETEEEFLKTRYKKMPRTMLRYAIERFPEDLRLKYLKGNV